MQKIYSGYYQSCSYLNNNFHCWGTNKNGEADLPSVYQNEYIIHASVGRHYVCTIHNGDYCDVVRENLEYGNAFCMGNNDYHQTEVPESYTEGYKLRNIQAGDYHTCAIGEDESLCWGRNDHGQSDIPEAKRTMVASISVRAFSTCYISNANICCFGKFKYNHDQEDVNLIGFAMIFLGYNHVCYNLNKIVCEGDNEFGQLNFNSNLILLSMGSYGDHVCGSDYIGDSGPHNVCWGRNDLGQTDLSQLSTDDFSFVSVGEKHSCFIKGKTYVECIGTNEFNLNIVPHFVKNHIQVIEIGGKFSCALRGGVAECFGKGKEKLNKFPASHLHNSTEISTGFNHVCSSFAKPGLNSSIACWFAKSKDNPIIQPPSTLTHEKVITQSINSGYKFSCISFKPYSNPELSHLLCWGLNDFGQLDLPSNIISSPQHDLSIGIAHACTIYNPTLLVCWGRDDKEQASVPSLMMNDSISVGCGYYHTCAVDKEYMAKCWGFNGKGQTDIPKAIEFIMLMVVGGGDFSCGIKLDTVPKAVCWGGGGVVQVPKQWASGLSKLSAGQDHACLLTERGKAKCWGNDEYGQASWVES